MYQSVLQQKINLAHWQYSNHEQTANKCNTTVHCWANVYEVKPAINHVWANASRCRVTAWSCCQWINYWIYNIRNQSQYNFICAHVQNKTMVQYRFMWCPFTHSSPIILGTSGGSRRGGGGGQKFLTPFSKTILLLKHRSKVPEYRYLTL